MERRRTTPWCMLIVLLASAIACSSEPQNGNAATDQPNDGAPAATAGTGSPQLGGGSNPSASDPSAAAPGAPAPSDTDPNAPDPSDPDPANSDPQPGGASDPTTPLSEIPDNCIGFEVLGLTHSPGGSVLPNTCAPFHGTLNNPYAIRCIDADPSFETSWPGDDFCILPPEPDKGTQVHVGPTSYDDPAAYDAFLLQPGEEINNFYYIKSSNEEPHYYYRTNWRMRDGSHHMIINSGTTNQPEGWSVGSAFGVGGELAGLGNVGGSQRTDTDRPQGTLEIPAENRGIGAMLAARQQLTFNLHHMNRFQEPVLREAWVNIWYMDESEVEQPLQGISISGSPLDINIAPGQHTVLHYKCDVTGNTRIITLLGPRHAWTERFGIWIQRASGEEQSIYESFDYQDMPVFQFDSVSQNPVPDVATRIDGAHTGMLEVAAGDQIHFVCDINNQSDVTLRYANELLTGEMCMLFGSMTGASLCRSGTRVFD